jgi:hypothetical protein
VLFKKDDGTVKEIADRTMLKRMSSQNQSWNVPVVLGSGKKTIVNQTWFYKQNNG